MQFVIVVHKGVTRWDVWVSIENKSGGFFADTIESGTKLTVLIFLMFFHGATRCI